MVKDNTFALFNFGTLPLDDSGGWVGEMVTELKEQQYSQHSMC